MDGGTGWQSIHKQGEHIPQHSYISHNHPYISSSDTLGGTVSISTATYIGMVVWNVAMLWNVFSLFVYFVSQYLNLSTQPYIW